MGKGMVGKEDGGWKDKLKGRVEKAM